MENTEIGQSRALIDGPRVLNDEKTLARQQVSNDGSGVSSACASLADAIDRLEHQRHVVIEHLRPTSIETAETVPGEVGADPVPPRSTLTAFLFDAADRISREADRLAEAVNGSDL